MQVASLKLLCRASPQYTLSWTSFSGIALLCASCSPLRRHGNIHPPCWTLTAPLVASQPSKQLVPIWSHCRIAIFSAIQSPRLCTSTWRIFSVGIFWEPCSKKLWHLRCKEKGWPSTLSSRHLKARKPQSPQIARPNWNGPGVDCSHRVQSSMRQGPVQGIPENFLLGPSLSLSKRGDRRGWEASRPNVDIRWQKWATPVGQ